MIWLYADNMLNFFLYFCIENRLRKDDYHSLQTNNNCIMASRLKFSVAMIFINSSQLFTHCVWVRDTSLPTFETCWILAPGNQKLCICSCSVCLEIQEPFQQWVIDFIVWMEYMFQKTCKYITCKTVYIFLSWVQMYNNTTHWIVHSVARDPISFFPKFRDLDFGHVFFCYVQSTVLCKGLVHHEY